MSKRKAARRDTEGKFAQKYTPAQMVRQWVLWLVSVGVVYGVGRFMASDFAAFRSCNRNDTGLYINNCGKQGINVGDLVVIAVFVASILLAVGLFNSALRMTRKTP